MPRPPFAENPETAQVWLGHTTAPTPGSGGPTLPLSRPCSTIESSGPGSCHRDLPDLFTR
jgi:hypothetical protein